METREESWFNTNVADTERWLSVIGGSALAAYGLKNRSIGGLVAAALGGALIWRGATGYCPLFGVLGVSTGMRRSTVFIRTGA